MVRYREIGALALLLPLGLFAQDRAWRSTLPVIGASGVYRIALTPEITGRSQDDLDDLRLIDSTGHEVPYVLGIAQPQRISVGSKDFIIRRNEVLAGHTVVELERPADEPLIDNMEVFARNTAVAKPMSVTGSDDGAQWFAIYDHVLDPFTHEREPVAGQLIHLPATDYRYYRITLNDSLAAPVQVLSVRYHTFPIEDPHSSLYQVATVGRSQVEIGGLTRIRVRNAYPITIARIEFEVAEPTRFHRRGRVEGYRTGTQGRGRKSRTVRDTTVLETFIISSDGRTAMDFEEFREDSFDVVIENGNDRALGITDVRFMQWERSITADLLAGHTYTLVGGAVDRQRPHYDLVHFSGELSTPLDTLVPSAPVLEALAAVEPIAFDPHRWWIWAAIIALMLGMGWMALRMLRRP